MENALIEAAAHRVMNLMERGDSYHIALASTIGSTHLTPTQWIFVIRRIEELRTEERAKLAGVDAALRHSTPPRMHFRRERDDVGGGFGSSDY